MRILNYYSLKIYSLSGGFVNRQDGGFFLAKFISEFGYIGILILGFLASYIRYYFRNNIAHNSSQSNFIYFFLCSLIVPIIFRDVGYFSFSTFFFFFAIGYLFSMNKKIHLKNI
jgi:hypothetical protein